MSAIDKLQARPTLQRALVQQAMQEAKADPAAQQKLQQLVDHRAGDFEDAGLVDTVSQFLQGLCKDQFEVVQNRQTGAIGKPEVLEARITKVKDEERRVDITPPPPAPPVYRRDPLNVTGKAAAGSTVEFYNASVPGRPILGNATADATGAFSYELTDETKFVFGDQIGVRLVGSDGNKGRPLIVPTEPFLITNTATTYFTRQSGTPVDVRTDHTSRTDALDKKTDDRPPFFQAAKVDNRLEIPSTVEQPYAFTLLGKDDAVEPNSTITVMVGTERYQTKVDDQGQFALKVKDIIPGQQLKIEVRDINGHGIDIPARVPPIALPTPQLISAMRPDTDGVHLAVDNLIPPGGALVVRNARTGVMSELSADQSGKVSGLVKGIAPFDAFEIAVRDVNGHISDDTALLVHLPAAGKSKTGSVVAADTLNTRAPNLEKAIACLTGPPVDIIVGGQTRPGGPFLPLQHLPKLPPHAVLEVVKDGDIVQALRADASGSLDGAMLRGVHVGDAVSFRLRDAAGRRFPGQVDGFVVPDGKVTSKVTTQVPPALVTLSAQHIGSGTLGLDPLWLAPANILVGKTAPTGFEARHAVTSQVGGALLKAPEPHFMATHFPALPLSEGASLSVTQSPGRKTIAVDVKGQAGSPVSFSYDDTLGTFLPALTDADLPRLKVALEGAVAVVGAAYAQGKEPGDVGYDRALGVAKTIMFMLDRLAVDQPQHAKAAADVAVSVLGTKPFLFEIAPKGVVGDGRSVDIETQSQSSMSLLQTRTMAMGEVGRSDGLRKPTHAAVDVATLSSAASYAKGSLTIAGKGLVAPGDELLIKAGETIHRVTADAKGNVDVSLSIAPGTVVEMSQRKAPTGDGRSDAFNPISRAVVMADAILGEGNLVPLEALTQRAPSAVAVTDALFNGGAAPRGLPPGGSVVVVKDGATVATVAIDAAGGLGAAKLGLKPGDLVDVRVNDAAGRPFAAMMLGHVVGQKVTKPEQQDTTAMTLQAVVDAVGTGSLVLPSFPKGNGATQEAYAELKPMWGNSAGVTEEHGRFSTKAKFPDGLLPDLAKGSEKPGALSMGNSVSLSAHQWDSGEVNLNAGYYIENQRPDFGFVFDPRTGDLRDRFNAKTPLVPQGLAKLTSLLQTSIAFVAMAQKQGSEPGDGFYDLASRTAKSTLVIFDSLIQNNPTLATEIKAALRAALPASMPFDLPVGNAPASLQTPPTEGQPPKALQFWNAVGLDDFKTRPDRAMRTVATFEIGSQRPAVGGHAGLATSQPAVNRPFFGGGSFFGPRSSTTEPKAESTIPMYLRGRLTTD